MAKNIESIKHKADKRAHIPSKEEAGYEDANAQVQSGKKVLELTKNPVVHRGQDPELFWLNKYGNDDRDNVLRVDIRSLYRHEHIAPETLIQNLYKITESKSEQTNLFSVNELFGNALDKDEIEKVSEYYQHQDGWTNRLIQGDSHLVMASLLEREGMVGQTQSIYFDPPYGIAYNSNWQLQLNDTALTDGKDEALTGEPEVIKAFRDTWELGIHSYLTYLRDRLLIARELLTESGSCFVQISAENVHLVRSVMEEVFGSANFVSQINLKRASVMFTKKYLKENMYYVLWFAKDIENLKYRQLYFNQDIQDFANSSGSHLWFEDINTKQEIKATPEQRKNVKDYLNKNKNLQLFSTLGLNAQGIDKQNAFVFKGQKYYPPKATQWKTSYQGLDKLVAKNRIILEGNNIRYKYYYDDYPVTEMGNYWESIGAAGDKLYVVQTNDEIVQRCILMTTDPGDLVLDPTCGSGTTAFVSELLGRRWITIDTSRIALNIAKQRIMSAVYPYFELHDVANGDVRQGFKYKTAPHITLGSLANDEEAARETLYDQPIEDNSKLRVSGPFTVETLQNYEPISPAELDDEVRVNEENGAFEEVIKQHLVSAGVKNGRKNEMVIFGSVELLSHSYLHAEGFYMIEAGEKKAYFHIGPKFGTVSKTAVNEAIKECQARGDASWLIILGFSFESDIEGSTQTMSMGKFEVTKCRIHDDLLQEGLKKKPAKSAASFVTIGEPDIDIVRKGQELTVEIKGLDIYDPIKDEVKARNISDIAYWMVDEDYDGSNFIVRQVFFCGGDKDEFTKWKKGLSSLAKDSTKRKVERTLKIEIDDEAFDRLYGHISHPIEVKKKGQKIAVRIISQFGEECTKVLITE
jgi:adenine-specific DNA-methyltransferase